MEKAARIADDTWLGIGLMLGFCVLAPLADAIAKVLSVRFEIGQLVLVRFAAQALLFTPVALWLGRIVRPGTRVLGLIAWRTGLHILGVGAMFLSLRFLPLADAIAIAYVMPFVMLLLGRVFLNETVGWRRIAACAVGFAGTLMVVQPSFAEVGWPALLPLFVAVDFALFMLVTRQVAKDVDPVALQAVSGWMALAVLLPVVLAGGALDLPGLGLARPEGGDWLLLAALAAFGPGAHLVLTWSLRFAPSATVAPIQYLEIPVATFYGWAIFRDFPDGLAFGGILVTVAAGLYVVLRERAVSRQGLPAPRGAPPAPEG